MSLMDDDFDNPSSQANLIKWPFYLANVLILGIVVSYVTSRRAGPLDKWEIAICVFAVALSAMLFFVPHLVEYFISVYFPQKRNSAEGGGLPEKTYLELKNLKEILSDFGVKLEKIPSIVETISKNASQGDGDSHAITKMEDELGAFRAQIQQLIDRGSPEPDSRLTALAASVVALEKAVDRIGKDLAKRPHEGPAEEWMEKELGDNLAKVDRILEETQSADSNAPKNEVEEEQSDNSEEPETPDPEKIEELDLELPEEDEPEPENEEVDQSDETELEEDDETEPEDEDEETDETETETEVDDEDEDGTETETEPEDEVEDEDDDGTEDEPEVEDDEPDDEPDDSDEPDEDDGTESEVDEDEAVEEDKPVTEAVGVLKGVSQAEVVVAKILPGIGNKVFLRGEGAGLSWDEGVPMSFLEIGKWGWSPSDKSVPLVIQLYKNDEEPDPNGKVELEPGEKVEITPVFVS
jgi:hypothetical protein